MKILAKNKKAHFDYEILEEFEAGIVLKGYEVKSVRLGRMKLEGSFVILKNEEVWLLNAHIPPYQPKNTPSDYDPYRSRKLLLKKKEIKYLIGKSRQKGLTLIPIEVYSKRGKIKVKVGVVKGRKKFNKKELLKKRAIEREIQRELKLRG